MSWPPGKYPVADATGSLIVGGVWPSESLRHFHHAFAEKKKGTSLISPNGMSRNPRFPLIARFSLTHSPRFRLDR
jgi:hypothetical protein